MGIPSKLKQDCIKTLSETTTFKNTSASDVGVFFGVAELKDYKDRIDFEGSETQRIERIIDALWGRKRKDEFVFITFLRLVHDKEPKGDDLRDEINNLIDRVDKTKNIVGWFKEETPARLFMTLVLLVLVVVISITPFFIYMVSTCKILLDNEPLEGEFTFAVAIDNQDWADTVFTEIQTRLQFKDKPQSCRLFYCKIDPQKVSTFAEKMNADLLIWGNNNNLKFHVNNPAEGVEDATILANISYIQKNTETFTEEERVTYMKSLGSSAAFFVNGVKLLLGKKPSQAKKEFVDAGNNFDDKFKPTSPNEFMAWTYLYEGRAWLDLAEETKTTDEGGAIAEYVKATNSFTQAISWYTGKIIMDCEAEQIEKIDDRDRFLWAELGCGLSKYRQAILLDDDSAEQQTLLAAAESLFESIIDTKSEVEGYVFAKAYTNQGLVYLLNGDADTAIKYFNEVCKEYENHKAPIRFQAEALVMLGKGCKGHSNKCKKEPIEYFTDALELLEEENLTDEDQRWFTYQIPMIKADALIQTAQISYETGLDPSAINRQFILNVYQSVDSDNDNELSDTYVQQKYMDLVRIQKLLGDYERKEGLPQKAQTYYNQAREDINDAIGNISGTPSKLLDWKLNICIDIYNISNLEAAETCYTELIDTNEKNVVTKAYIGLGEVYQRLATDGGSIDCNKLVKANQNYTYCDNKAQQNPKNEKLHDICRGKIKEIKEYQENNCL